ncbi:type I restriction enzyme HsdR N-terminal domain-containing protein [Sediminibacterium ginsengisoli]|uniref:Type I restriction enzyme R protein N terminus (HSDR_N) n=1 Tax=Sediminibacterium ginsengisoli TaxID=413434 RepID=A0A1T4QDJ6_9BACT|nr:type I restriction enzyme HsdR N-terminal domain-containing protein [Sediminibacterium ginsengisoli]SKA01802.1 Type I restriction enzyme R protein N terminus (HSDR_N) [Sediminibacterium ginsengisoli]
MIKITYPSYDHRIKKEGEKAFIFDPLRKRWIRLTPEEWVRQNLLQYLLQTKQYPASLIAVEKEIRLGEMRRRFDLVVYKDARPWLLIECKEPDVPLNESVLRQILHYNTGLQTSYLILSNGHYTRGFSIAGGVATELSSFPDFI